MIALVVVAVVVAGGDDEATSPEASGGGPAATTATSAPLAAATSGTPVTDTAAGVSTLPGTVTEVTEVTEVTGATGAADAPAATGAGATAATGDAPPATVAPEPGGAGDTATPPIEGGTPGPSPPTQGALALRTDGLAELDFGAAPAEVVDAMTARYGEPTEQIESVTPPAGCAYTAATTVTFASSTLTLTFADRRAESEAGTPPRPQFVSWRIAPIEGAEVPVVRTFEGTTMGTTVAGLRATYGPRLAVAAETPQGATLVVDRDQAPGALVIETTGVGESDVVRGLAAGSCTL